MHFIWFNELRKRKEKQNKTFHTYIQCLLSSIPEKPETDIYVFCLVLQITVASVITDTEEGFCPNDPETSQLEPTIGRNSSMEAHSSGLRK